MPAWGQFVIAASLAIHSGALSVWIRRGHVLNGPLGGANAVLGHAIGAAGWAQLAGADLLLRPVPLPAHLMLAGGLLCLCVALGCHVHTWRGVRAGGDSCRPTDGSERS